MRASRHPHRAVRRPGPDPLPDRRRAASSATRPPPAARRRSSAASRSWASIDIAEKRRPQDGRIKITSPARTSTCASASCRPSTASRSSCGSSTATTSRSASGPRVRRRGLQAVPADHQAAQRHLPRHRADRLGQDDHALRRAQRAEPARRKIITAEDPVEYYLPGVNQCEVKAQDRADLRPHHPGHAAAEPEHHPGRRNPRPGDGRDRHPGFSDRTLGFQYTAHERCAQCYYDAWSISASSRSWSPARSWRSWPSAWCGRSARNARQRYEPPAHILQAAGPPARDRQEGELHEGQGCSHCNKTGYRGRMGIYEMMTMTHHDPRDDLQGRVRPRRSAKWPANRGCGRCFEDGMIKALKGLTTLDEVLGSPSTTSVAEPADRPPRTAASGRRAGSCAGTASPTVGPRTARRRRRSRRAGRTADRARRTKSSICRRLICVGRTEIMRLTDGHASSSP